MAFISPVDEYLRLSRLYSRAYGRRKTALRNRLTRLWETMTPDQQAETSRRWRDPS